MKKILVITGLAAVLASAGSAGAEEAGQATTRLSEVEVQAEGESETRFKLPDVVGAQLFVGKKTTVASIEDLPPIATNNFRTIFHGLPGLVVSEVPNESFLSANFRGVGDPHEGFNLTILRDGIPIQADIYGYSAAYYQPPAQQIERVELTRGGGALLYGPQPGAVVNMITRQPEFEQDLTFRTNQMFGEKRLYSTYNEISGGDKESAGMGFYHRRQSDGFRSANSDFQINNAGVKTAYQLAGATTLRLDFDVYNGDFGEPGGLTLEQAEGLASFNQNRWQNTTNFDRLRIERYAPTASLTTELSADSSLEAQLFGAQFKRFSRRQDYGTAPTFGGFPLGTTNTIQIQEFRTVGANLRYLQTYDLCGEDQHFTAGLLLYGVDSPFRQEAGDSVVANTGLLKRDLSRQTGAVAAYIENQFRFGDLKVVPGVRVENIYQSIEENVNAAVTNDLLREDSQWDTVPLFGLGTGYEVTRETELYANISQSYKPVAYQDFVPLGPGDVVSRDLDAADAYTVEAGYRGAISQSTTFDMSLFRTQYDNQFGRVATEIRNVGRGVYQGLEVGGSIGLLALADELNGATRAAGLGDLKLNLNATFLDAEFSKGPLEGATPQYAPKYLIRPGVSYEKLNSFRLALLATLQSDVYGDDANSANRYIPSFEVFDLLADVFLADQISVNFGVNNLFDENYYSRIRGNGVDPAPPRNIYAGMTLTF